MKRVLRVVIAYIGIFLFGIPWYLLPYFSIIPRAEAAASTVTSSADFQAGEFNGVEATSKEGEIKLNPAGTWGPRVFHTPHLAQTDQSALASDGTYIYLLTTNDSHFSKYVPSENKWKELANAPHYAYVGADLVVLGNYIYAEFGGYQKEFARYSIADNTWTDMENMPELVANGASLATDGTNIFATRGTATTDFWKYTVATDAWSTITSAPATLSGGTSLYYYSGYLYALRGSGTTTFYRYDIAAGTWSSMTVAPGTINEDHNVDGNGDFIYVTRDQGTQTFYRYQISTNAWTTLTNTPQATRYVGVVYNSGDGYLYVFRGNGTNDFWKYDIGAGTFLGPADLVATPGYGADLLFYNSTIYHTRGNSTANFYSYSPASNAWTTLTSAPSTFGDDTKGVVAGSILYFLRGSSTLTFYSYNTGTATWATLANTPATIMNGGTLTYPGSGDYIYATRGGVSRLFYQYSISGNTWSDVAVADLPDDAEAAYGARLVTDGTNLYYITGTGIAQILKYTVATDTWSVLSSLPFSPYAGTDATYYNGKIYMVAGYYKNDFWEYTISGNTWRRLKYLPGNYGQDIGPYNGATLESDGAGTLYYIPGANFLQMHTYTVNASNYVSSGTWTSAVMDQTYVASWTSLTASVTTPSDSTITYETRTSTDKVTWSSWEAVSGGTIASPVRRYIQVKATLTASTGQSVSPTLASVTITYAGDSTAPTNASVFTGSSASAGGTALVSGSSYSYAAPYFTWSGATDAHSSVSGYYVYFGTSSSADPETAGNLQTTAAYTVTTPLSNGTYYLRVKTKDSAGNISSAISGFTYIYSGVSPSTVTATTTADFSTGTTSNVTTTSDTVKLSGKSGFWQQERLSLAPAGFSYGASFGYVSSSNKLYTFRGAGTTTFYEYAISTDTWTTLAVAPASVNNGGVLVEGPSGYLYAVRGANTTTFWRYDIAANTWSDAAAADSPQQFDYGSDLKYDGSRYIYALRGNSDDTFMRYDTSVDTWEVLTNIDFGGPADQVNNLVYIGGDLAFDGGDKVYAIQGNTRSGFAQYSIASASWSTLTNVPSLAYTGAQIEYDATTNAIYYTPGWDRPYLYKYSLDTQTWSELAETPIVMSAGTAMRIVDGYIYITRGASSNILYRYNIAKDSWLVPTRGMLGTIFRGTEYFSFGYGADIVKGDGDNFYLTQGNFNNIFVRYNGVTGEATHLADLPAGMYQGGDFVYDSTNNKIYALASLYYRKFFVYDVATDIWTEESSDLPPADVGLGASMAYDGSRYIYVLRGGSTTTFYRFDTQGSSGAKWTTLTVVPATIGAGGDLVIRGNYIYAFRGNTTVSFYRYDIGANTWSDAAVADLGAGLTVAADGFLADTGSGDSIYACRGVNTASCYSYSISGNSWSTIATAPASITAGGAAATNGSNKIFVIAGAGTNTYANGLYTYVLETSTSSFQESGSFISATHDLGSLYRFANISLTYNSASNNALTVSTRTSADGSTWADWAEASEIKSISTTNLYKINSAVNRYIQVKLALTSSDGVGTGSVDDYVINYYTDATAPVNPSVLNSYATATQAASITTDTWYNYTAPNFDWPDAEAVGGATDTVTGSSVTGYYVYFGTNSSADPETDGTLQSQTAYTASSLTSGSTYYLRIKAEDDAGNVASSAWQPFIYKFDNTAPSNPSTVIATPPGYTNTDSFDFSWSGATDSASAVSQYCYKTGEAGAVDTCTSAASVSAVLSYQSGTNVFYVRAKDTAGNIATDYVNASYYYSSTAPGAPQDLEADPVTNTVNEFAFTWTPPALYSGAQSGLRYYYSVNAYPTALNVNAVGLSTAYVTADAYATVPGANRFYVVAKDEAGNIDYSNYASVEFVADTSAPGIVRNMDISDVSVKTTNNWRLAVSWDAPVSSGSGVASYKVYKSSTEGAVCASDDSSFSYLASTTTESYVATGLSQQEYNYCIKACDSTNNCSAYSDTVSLYPDGKWTEAPSMSASPSASIKTKSATISWSTDRTANSFVKYGTKSGDYGDEVGSSEHVAYHEIEVSGLDPGTKYYYQVLWTDEDGNTGSSDELSLETNAAPFVSDVKVKNTSITSTYLTFTVKNASKVTVQYGKTSSYGGTKSISTAKSETEHTVLLDDLIEGTFYHYRIVAEDEEENTFAGDDYTFETLPVPKITALKVQQVAGLPTATLRLVWSSNTEISTIVTYYPENNSTAVKDFIALKLTKSHDVLLKDLRDDSDYVLTVRGKDAAGNEANFPVQKVKTAVDFRPPEILNMSVESTIIGVGDEAKAQIIVSWDTDEPATTQVEYADGTGTTYGQSTQEDPAMTTNHTVTITGLTPAKIYHLRALSKDKANNSGKSSDYVVVTPKSTKDALSLVIDSLSKTFSFLKEKK